ncbi:MAG: hypothetical protein ACYSWW_07525 [Planctomycetota bacterium]
MDYVAVSVALTMCYAEEAMTRPSRLFIDIFFGYPTGMGFSAKKIAATANGDFATLSWSGKNPEF